MAPNSAKFSDGGNFFQVPTVGFTTFEYPYNIGLYLGYIVCVLRKIAYIQKFREINSPVSCMQPARGHHCAKTYGKMVPSIYIFIPWTKGGPKGW